MKNNKVMKKTLTSIAAALTLLLALSGCNFSSDKSNKGKGDPPSPNWTLEQFLRTPIPVEIATGNTLSSTPDDIRNLVSDFDIDIRNSAYLILQHAKNENYYTQFSGKLSEYLFFMISLVYPIYEDPGVSNAMATDYNDCIRSIGVERLNKGEGGQCANMWGHTWKKRVFDRLFASPSLQNSLYGWLKPELSRMVNSFDNSRRTYMSNAINHMIAYTDNYNHQAEKNFYRECQNSKYGEKLFVLPYRVVNMTPMEDEEVTNPYRYLETWVYRRVEEGTMSANQINEWLRRIKTDMGL